MQQSSSKFYYHKSKYSERSTYSNQIFTCPQQVNQWECQYACLEYLQDIFTHAVITLT